jgi:hypothetical protein
MHDDLVPPDGVVDAATLLAEPEPMRRGSVSERFMKCGQAGCRCREDDKARHGPYYSLTRMVQGRTRSRYLTPEQAQVAREQVAAGQRFRQRLDAYWEACERWADAQLDATEAAPDTEAAKKGASKKSSTPRSSGKSKR